MMSLAETSIPARPVLQRARCSACGACARACEVEAVTMVPRGVLLEPRFDLDRCTRCHQCHEACPSDAIELQPEPRRSPGLASRLLGRFLGRRG